MLRRGVLHPTPPLKVSDSPPNMLPAVPYGVIFQLPPYVNTLFCCPSLQFQCFSPNSLLRIFIWPNVSLVLAPSPPFQGCVSANSLLRIFICPNVSLLLAQFPTESA